MKQQKSDLKTKDSQSLDKSKTITPIRMSQDSSIVPKTDESKSNMSQSDKNEKKHSETHSKQSQSPVSFELDKNAQEKQKE